MNSAITKYCPQIDDSQNGKACDWDIIFALISDRKHKLADKKHSEVVAAHGTRYRLRRLVYRGDVEQHIRGGSADLRLASLSMTRNKWNRVFEVLVREHNRYERFDGPVPLQPAAYRMRLNGLLQRECTVRYDDDERHHVLVARTVNPVFSRRQYISNDDDVSLYSVRKVFAWYSCRKIYRNTRSQLGPRRPLAVVRAGQPFYHELKVLDSSITRNELTALLFFLILVNDLDSHR